MRARFLNQGGFIGGTSRGSALSPMWYYTFFALALWFVSPGLRRIFDWQFGFSSINVISILPLLATIPHLIALTLGGGWRRLPRPLLIAAWLWVSGFTYALALAVVNGNILTGSYAFVAFVFPLGIGLWIASQDLPHALATKRLTRFLFAFTTVVSIYGIIQFVIVPPWDAFWLKHIGLGALGGFPKPFAVRVFSTFGSAAPFAVFLACMLLLSLPYLTPKRPWLLAQIPIWVVAFGLSSVRTGWLMFVLGLAAYIPLCAKPRTAFSTLVICATLTVGGFALLASATESDLLTTRVVSRLQTLNELNADQSANERQNLYADSVGQISIAPLGRGLGLTGVATKLGAVGQTTDFDSGLLARLIEMGGPGALLLLAAFVVSFGALLSVWTETRSRDPGLQDGAAASIAILVAITGSVFSTDIAGLLTLLFWLNVSLVLMSAGDTGKRLAPSAAPLRRA